jgi:hypothetical protein
MWAWIRSLLNSNQATAHRPVHYVQPNGGQARSTTILQPRLQVQRDVQLDSRGVFSKTATFIPRVPEDPWEGGPSSSVASTNSHN